MLRLDKGVDGFCLDVINLIAKREGLPDGRGTPDSEGYTFAAEHAANQPKLDEYLREIKN